jgi:hypothetical protein
MKNIFRKKNSAPLSYLLPLGALPAALLSIANCTGLTSTDYDEGDTSYDSSSTLYSSSDPTAVHTQNDHMATPSDSLSAHYDAASRKCVDSTGAARMNWGVLAECGYISGDNQTFVGQDFTGKSLKGMILENSNLQGAVFDGADLTDAFIKTVSLYNASFRGATLYGAQIQVNPSDFQVQAGGLSGAYFDSNTYLPSPATIESMTQNQMIAKNQIKAGSWSFQDSSGNALRWTLDSALTPNEQAVLGDVFAHIQSRQFSSSTSSNFNLVFKQGGTGVVSYLNDRVLYLSGDEDNHPTAGNANLTLAAYNSGVGLWQQQQTIDVSNLTATNSLYVDRMREFRDNPSATSLDSDLRLADPKPNPLSINGASPKVSSPRSGVIHLGPAFEEGQDIEVERSTTIVHEARHSDCHNPTLDAQHKEILSKLADLKNQLQAKYATLEAGTPLSPDQKNALTNFLNTAIATQNSLIDEYTKYTSARASDPTCGYGHIDCPSDSPDVAIRGAIGSCDAMAWGAYSMGAIYATEIYQNCTNCTEIEKQVANAVGADSFNRVQRLEDLTADKYQEE